MLWAVPARLRTFLPRSSQTATCADDRGRSQCDLADTTVELGISEGRARADGDAAAGHPPGPRQVDGTVDPHPAGEIPVNVLDWLAGPAAPVGDDADPDEGRLAASDDIRTSDELRTFLQAMNSRRKDTIAVAQNQEAADAPGVWEPQGT